MAAGVTYTQISTTTVSPDTTTVTINVPTTTYSDLQIVARLKSSTAGTGVVTGRLRFNSNTSAVYSTIQNNGTGTTTPAVSNTINETSLSLGNVPAAGNTSVFSNISIEILNYRNSTHHKTVLIKNDSELNGQGLTSMGVSLWYPATSAAITSISFFLDSGNVITNSTIDIYGITAA